MYNIALQVHSDAHSVGYDEGHDDYYNDCEVEKDEEGIQTMKVLGQNMAWLLKKIHA